MLAIFNQTWKNISFYDFNDNIPQTYWNEGMTVVSAYGYEGNEPTFITTYSADYLALPTDMPAIPTSIKDEDDELPLIRIVVFPTRFQEVLLPSITHLSTMFETERE